MPVVRTRDRIPRPVRPFAVEENHPCVTILLVRVAPYVEVALDGSTRCLARSPKPYVLVGRVIEHQLDDHLHSPFVCGVQKTPEVIEGPVARVDVAVVRYVVAVVAKRRWKERKKPEAIDAKSFEIVEFLDEPWEIADAVRVPVAKRLDGQLVDDRALIPQTIALATLVRHWDRYATRSVNVQRYLMINHWGHVN